MDFMETLKDVAASGAKVVADGAKVVAEKSSELVESSKVQYMIFELKQEVKKLYSEIGKLTYASLENGEDNAEDIKLKCDIISAKLAKIEVLKTAGKTTDSTCPNCGRKANSSDSFCPTCGADMVVDADVEVMD